MHLQMQFASPATIEVSLPKIGLVAENRLYTSVSHDLGGCFVYFLVLLFSFVKVGISVG
jgi:hypothetical protein